MASIQIFAPTTQKSKETEQKNKRRKTSASNDDAEETKQDVLEKVKSFKDLKLAPWLVNQCRAMGINTPTPVQANCIPVILNGQDCIGYAKTGSGKTAAFALPMLQCLGTDPYGVYGLVLTPSRELAFQIGEQFHVLGSAISLREIVVVGGVDMMKQSLELSRLPHVIIATPGRLADHITNAHSISLNRVAVLVLDEADRLLSNSTLQDDLDVIFDALPKKRQTLLFSATKLENISHPILDGLEQPFEYEAESSTATVAELKQEYILMPSQVRLPYFINLLKHLDSSDSCIVFTSTCRSCEEITIVMKELEFECTSLHSEMSQANRLASLGKFRSGFVQYLIATDVASRGLDIAPVKMVINFNVPLDPKDYIHRVGRTARAGKYGRAVTLVSERDVALLQAVEAKTGVKMSGYHGLAEKDVLKTLNKINIARRKAALQLLESGFLEKRKKRKQRRAKAMKDA
eukprot:m.59865 g.59865  ORF g.59865 m.59865 type:complete len:462 (-) comp11278_c0_seq1:13-1398(-)